MAKVKVNEEFTREQFARRLRALADALEMGAGYRLLLQGREIIIPTTAKKWKIGYESSNGKHEVEFEIKWGARVREEDDSDADTPPEEGEESPAEEEAAAAPAKEKAAKQA